MQISENMKHGTLLRANSVPNSNLNIIFLKTKKQTLASFLGFTSII